MANKNFSTPLSVGDTGEDGRRVPVPDPTALTTAALLREIASLKELVFTRLDGVEAKQDSFNEAITKTPTDVDKQVQHLKELHEEKFVSIATQFKERDIRTEQTARDSKVAVDAALQAAKEAVAEQNKSSALAISKSEAATVKQIDQIQTQISTSTKGLDDKISDIKDRLTRIEGDAVGSAEQKITQDTSSRFKQTSNSFVVSVVAVSLSFITLIYLVIRTATGH